jgi:hypothetical protein
MATKKILCIGGAGQLGKFVTKSLLTILPNKH